MRDLEKEMEVMNRNLTNTAAALVRVQREYAHDKYNLKIGRKIMANCQQHKGKEIRINSIEVLKYVVKATGAIIRKATGQDGAFTGTWRSDKIDG